MLENYLKSEDIKIKQNSLVLDGFKVQCGKILSVWGLVKHSVLWKRMIINIEINICRNGNTALA